ncbi:MAG TPA: ribbon-helix-helix domain-containing protein [Candidatus Nanoarchaeia archaeon]|nr:ribbon-helix-helix domain-containing protein [Candidatus Nanoarchaeia archaeon]
MDAITIKMDEKMLKEMDRKLGEHRYSTRTEFIRDAIRDKLSELEKEEILKSISRLRGISRRKTSDQKLHAAGEEAFQLFEKKFKIK